jgi:hypothetical protein
MNLPGRVQTIEREHRSNGDLMGKSPIIYRKCWPVGRHEPERPLTYKLEDLHMIKFPNSVSKLS